MNGVPEYYEVKMKQTSKGIWYCDGFTASTKELSKLPDLIDRMMSLTEDLVRDHNKEAEETTADKWKKAGKNYEKGLKEAEK